MSNKTTFVVYRNDIATARRLLEKHGADCALEFLLAIADYSLDQIKPYFTIEQAEDAFVYGNIKGRIDIDVEHWNRTCEIRREAGRKGGIKSGEKRNEEKTEQTKQMKQMLRLLQNNENRKKRNEKKMKQTKQNKQMLRLLQNDEKTAKQNTTQSLVNTDGPKQNEANASFASNIGAKNEANEANEADIEIETEIDKYKDKEKEYKEKENFAENFEPPTPEEVEGYIRENDFLVNAKEFISFYNSKGWMVGQNKMQNWRSAIDGWHARAIEKQSNQPTQTQRTNGTNKSDRLESGLYDKEWKGSLHGFKSQV